MSLFVAIVLLTILTRTPVNADVIFAYPDNAPANSTYYWEQDVVHTGMPLSEAVNAARTNGGTRALEIRLLRRAGAEETVFRFDVGSTRRALRWRGGPDRQMKIVGQIDRSGPHPRALTLVAGQPLKETLCIIQGIDLCAGAMPETSSSRRDDILDYLSRELDRRRIIKGEQPEQQDVKLRLHCLLVWDSAFVVAERMGFRDCWLAAFVAYSSHNVALRGSIIEGSTYVLAAIGREGRPRTAHSFEMKDNIWTQSGTRQVSGSAQCDAASDWNCPISIWHDVPWAITHHFFWNPMNGALFASKDIAGNVNISGNSVYNAYNAVRAKLSAACEADSRCRRDANVGFEISNNHFSRIRDNAIEPERQAAFWVIKHNTFVDVYAAVSADGVAGHDLLVFGNIFLLTSAPGERCIDERWAGSRRFRISLGGGGRWSSDAAEGGDARCSTHAMGTVVKLGMPESAAPASALLTRILFFNNSLRTRSPLFRGTPAPPIISYNNAVQFTGCGEDQIADCRQDRENDPSCRDAPVMTRDRKALVVDCFPLLGLDGRPVGHRMRNNAYVPDPAGELDEVDRDRRSPTVSFGEPDPSRRQERHAVDAVFAINEDHPLAGSGCALRYRDGDIGCLAHPAALGALLPSGERFDLKLPFGFPFFKSPGERPRLR